MMLLILGPIRPISAQIYALAAIIRMMPHSGAECLNVKLGTSVKFTLHATLKSCKAETFVVTPVGIKDQMVVEVEPLCECPCAEEGDGVDLEDRFA